METQHGPGVVCLSNILLEGLTRRIKDRLRVRRRLSVAGEDGFLDGLTSPYASGPGRSFAAERVTSKASSPSVRISGSDAKRLT